MPQDSQKTISLIGGIHFSLASNYTVSKRLSHEGKATVTQLQIHKIKSKNTSLLASTFCPQYSCSFVFFVVI